MRIITETGYILSPSESLVNIFNFNEPKRITPLKDFIKNVQLIENKINEDNKITNDITIQLIFENGNYKFDIINYDVKMSQEIYNYFSNENIEGYFVDGLENLKNKLSI